MPGRIGKSGRVRSKAWTWLFSSRQSTKRVIRRIEIQPDDVAHLFHKLRVRRQLERVDAMRLQTKRLPDARDRRLREPGDVRHAARGPLGRVRRRAFQRAGDDVDNPIVGRFARRAWPRFVGQPFGRRRTRNRSRHLQTLLLDTRSRSATARLVSTVRAAPARCARAAPVAAPFSGGGPIAPACGVRPQSATIGLWWRFLGMPRSVPCERSKYKTFSETRH